MNSIDYGMGQTNIDKKTGIRFGVIPVNEVLQAWHDSSEPDYGKPSCPKCGNDAKENNHDADYASKSWWKCNMEYVCDNCEYCFDSYEAYGDEAIGYNLDDGQYQASQDSYGDIFIVKSPYYTLCEYCSPCAPGAGYIMNKGEVKAYCFGHDFFEDEKAPYKVFSVATGEEILSEKDKPNEAIKPYIMENGKVQSYAFPGGYPIYYITADNGVLCPDCVNKNMHLLNDKHDKQWYVVASEINYEDDSLHCDNCNKKIESAYGNG